MRNFYIRNNNGLPIDELQRERWIKFISSLLSTAKEEERERIREEVEKLKEPEQNDNEYSTINIMSLAQNKKINDVLSLLTPNNRE